MVPFPGSTNGICQCVGTPTAGRARLAFKIGGLRRKRKKKKRPKQPPPPRMFASQHPCQAINIRHSPFWAVGWESSNGSGGKQSHGAGGRERSPFLTWQHWGGGMQGQGGVAFPLGQRGSRARRPQVGQVGPHQWGGCASRDKWGQGRGIPQRALEAAGWVPGGNERQR